MVVPVALALAVRGGTIALDQAAALGVLLAVALERMALAVAETVLLALAVEQEVTVQSTMRRMVAVAVVVVQLIAQPLVLLVALGGFTAVVPEAVETPRRLTL